MKHFHKKESTWLESIIFSFFVHVLILIFLLTTPALLYLEQLSTADPNEPDELSTERLLVDLKDPITTEEVKSFVISSNAAEGSGQLTPPSDERVHLLGDFIPPSEGRVRTRESTQNLSTQSSKTPFEFSLNPGKSFPLTTTLDSPSSQQTAVEQEGNNSPSSRSGLESENTTNFRFHINDNQHQQFNIAKDSEAALFLDIKNSLSYKMGLYANSPGGAGFINYRYLKVGEVSAIVTVDRKGTMNFLEMQTASDDQPYLNYLIEKIVTHEQAVQNLPAWFTASSHDKLYFQIGISYKGPPLYQWWVNIQLLTQPPS